VLGELLVHHVARVADHQHHRRRERRDALTKGAHDETAHGRSVRCRIGAAVRQRLDQPAAPAGAGIAAVLAAELVWSPDAPLEAEALLALRRETRDRT
jgi:hypothetical protein